MLPPAGLLARLTSESSLEEQIGVLIGGVCPGAADTAVCEGVSASRRALITQLARMQRGQTS
jgi:hypothetical protein